MRILRIFACCSILLSLWSCEQRIVLSDEMTFFLEMSGANREELLKVIKHYSHEDDSLKLEAAYFLIRNMPFNYSYYGPQISQYDTIFQGMPERSTKQDNELWDGLTKKYGDFTLDKLADSTDLVTISGEYIIRNIDQAFEAWRTNPWSQPVDFQTFCHFILPYRCTTEHLSDWREKERTKYNGLKEALDDPADMLAAYKVIYDSTFASFGGKFEKYPFALSYDNYQQCRKGICDDEANMFVYALRANGIPAVVDFIPHWGNANKNHTWHAVIGPQDEAYTVFTEGGMPDTYGPISGAPPDEPGTRYFPDHIRSYGPKSIPKIYRKQFHKNDSSLIVLNHGREFIPDNLANIVYRDVTSKYLQVTDIPLIIDNPYDRHFSYLTIFDMTGWYPMAWGAIVDQTMVTFKEVGRNVLYLPVTISDGGQYTPAYPPVILHENGEIQKITANKRKPQTIKLYRKYPLWNYTLDYANYMYQGRFEGSDQPSFADAETLYTIDHTPPFITEVDVNPSSAYRYFRYVPRDTSYADISVLKFFSTTSGTEREIFGTPIGIEEKQIMSKLNKGLISAFDGDYETYYSIGKEPGGWVGIDAGKPVKVNKIHFCPRNDTNYIMPGELYELFYWDGEWISLGKKTGTYDQYLTYPNAPTGALFWLRNLDQGVEERVFTYENGKQLFW